jgi:peptidoglycan L-alanyl-D-glutamate endopeptidase CwlK
MPKFSERSLKNLQTCHIDLQVLFHEVIKYFDCIVTDGHRNKEDQDKAYASGNSKVKWPNGKHNKEPSLAADVYPYEPKIIVDWKDNQRFHYFAGYVMGIAQKLKEDGKITHAIRWGGDWDKDTQIKDESFRDTGHFEIIT